MERRYLQQRLTKDLTSQYDLLVQNSTGGVVQFVMAMMGCILLAQGMTVLNRPSKNIIFVSNSLRALPFCKGC